MDLGHIRRAPSWLWTEKGRTSIASKDLTDPNEHTGSLLWLAHRSQEPEHASMILEPVQWEQQVSLAVPFKKQRQDISWEAKDLPSVPALINPRAVKTNQRLVVLLEKKKAEQ